MKFLLGLEFFSQEQPRLLVDLGLKGHVVHLVANVDLQVLLALPDLLERIIVESVHAILDSDVLAQISVQLWT